MQTQQQTAETYLDDARYDRLIAALVEGPSDPTLDPASHAKMVLGIIGDVWPARVKEEENR